MGYGEKMIMEETFFKLILDCMQTAVCITDVETDEIVYMNDLMKQDLKVDNLEGRKCWQVLKKGMFGHCGFCKVDKLLDEPESAIQIWEEKSLVSDHVDKKYARIVNWRGRRYCVIGFIDVTEYIGLSESARIDELTGALSRREGKTLLAQVMKQAKEENKLFTVVLSDVNDLKKVNDKYGHSEGDNLLRFMSGMMKHSLDDNDIMFRLSGDEFIIIYYDQDVKEVDHKMQMVQQWLAEKRHSFSIYYDVSFSYGSFEVYPGDQYTISDIIGKADEQMYIQKRQFHIMQSRQLLKKNYEARNEQVDFEYDKEHLFEALTAGTDDYLFVGNMKTGDFRYSPSMVEDFGLPSEILQNAAAFWEKLIHPDDSEMFLESNQEIVDGRTDYHDIEYRARNIEGEWVWLRCRGKMLRDEHGVPDLFAGLITNLGRKNMTDHMTGLYNRYEFEGKIKKYLVDTKRVEQLGVIILNMDGFKNINDLYNHSFGDSILRITGQKIAAMLPENAKVYRLDGDEFGILVLNSNRDEALSIFSRIQHAFGKQQEYNGKKYYCTVSAGYASYPQDADNYLDLLKYGNYSLEHAKSAGKNRICTFTLQILREKERKLELMELLRESIERGYAGFSICYQPQVDSVTKELYGSEALARWHCTKYGDVSPGEFIPLLEQSGLIVKMGRWIFYHAAAQCKSWRDLKPDFHMSINLSYVQLLEDELVLYIKSTLEELDLPPENITLELTENYLIKEDTAVYKVLNELRELGLQIAMDDFGVGYSSLYALKSTPVDLVKIDRGFVKGIMKDMFTITFIKSITELCHKANKKVCLEGVEEAEEYNTVKEIGLELIQGFYFGHPIKADMFEKKFL